MLGAVKILDLAVLEQNSGLPVKRAFELKGTTDENGTTTTGVVIAAKKLYPDSRLSSGGFGL